MGACRSEPGVPISGFKIAVRSLLIPYRFVCDYLVRRSDDSEVDCAYHAIYASISRYLGSAPHNLRPLNLNHGQRQAADGHIQSECDL